MVSETTKACTNCGEIKPATTEFFHKHSRNKTYGLLPTCKVCISENYEATREKRRESSKKFRQANRKKRRENYKKYYETHREEINKKTRKRREASREEYNKQERERRALNPEPSRKAARKSSNKRRAQKLENGHIPYSETQVLTLYGTACHLCNLPINLEASRKAGIGDWRNGLHMDHVLPISKGGSDTLENVRPTHAACNLRKNNKY